MKIKNWFLAFVIITVIFVLGWSIFQFLEADKARDAREPLVLGPPSIDFEGKITSVKFDQIKKQNCDIILKQGYRTTGSICPQDTATVLVNKINKKSNPDVDINITEGEKIKFTFAYSARSAIIKRDVNPICDTDWILEDGNCIKKGCEGPDCTVKSPSYNSKPTEILNNTLIYHIPNDKDKENETVLPGIDEGDRIRVEDYTQGPIKMYEVIED